MYLSPINYQSKVMGDNINQKNQKVNAKNVDTVAFKGAKSALKTKDTGTIRNIMAASLAAGTTALAAIMSKLPFVSDYQKRLEADRDIDKGEIKSLLISYILNPILAHQLIGSTIEDIGIPRVEYSANAINYMVMNNIIHPKKTELLKKCLSRSYEFDDSNYEATYIVNKYPKEKVQEALRQSEYQENKVWNYPKNFYNPHKFVKKFEELYGKIDWDSILLK